MRAYEKENFVVWYPHCVWVIMTLKLCSTGFRDSERIADFITIISHNIQTQFLSYNYSF
jgi:hypothetical protein